MMWYGYVSVQFQSMCCRGQHSSKLSPCSASFQFSECHTNSSLAFILISPLSLLPLDNNKVERKERGKRGKRRKKREKEGRYEGRKSGEVGKDRGRPTVRLRHSHVQTHTNISHSLFPFENKAVYFQKVLKSVNWYNNLEGNLVMSFQIF